MSTPSNPAPAHRALVRARYAETDQAGVVYHSNYLQWFEVGRTEFLREMDLPYSRLEKELGIFLTVTETNLKYHRPALYDDLIAIETRIGELRRVRFRLDHVILRDEGGPPLCTGSIWLACVEQGSLRPKPLPAELLGALERVA